MSDLPTEPTAKAMLAAITEQHTPDFAAAVHDMLTNRAGIMRVTSEGVQRVAPEDFFAHDEAAR